MRCKIFAGYDKSDIEEEINDFFEDNPIKINYIKTAISEDSKILITIFYSTDDNLAL